MKIPHRHRLLTALALGALLATGFSVSAEPAAARDKDRKEHRDDRRDQRQERRQERRHQQQERRADRREVRQERREDRREARQERREDRQDARQDRQRQQVRARLAQQRAQQHRLQQQRAYQHRVRQQRAYQQRLQRQRVQQARAAAQRRAYAYSHNYYSPASRYRYNYGGRWYTTSHYGADVLRQAVQRGYREGLRAGRSDRYDRWNYNYSRSRIWIDGSYGFGGRYVSRADYAYYFRQGFERGYEDGYYDRGRYGHRLNGEAIIIQAVLEAILGFQRLG